MSNPIPGPDPVRVPRAEDLRGVELSPHYRRQVEAARLSIRAQVMGAADPAAQFRSVMPVIREDRRVLRRSLASAGGWTLVAAAFVWQVCEAAARGAREGLGAAVAVDPEARDAASAWPPEPVRGSGKYADGSASATDWQTDAT